MPRSVLSHTAHPVFPSLAAEKIRVEYQSAGERPTSCERRHSRGTPPTARRWPCSRRRGHIGRMSLWIASPPTARREVYASAVRQVGLTRSSAIPRRDRSCWCAEWLRFRRAITRDAVRLSTCRNASRNRCSLNRGPRAHPVTGCRQSPHRLFATTANRGSHLWIGDLDADRRHRSREPRQRKLAGHIAGRDRLAFTSEATDFDLVVVPLDGRRTDVFSSTRNELDPASSHTGAHMLLSDRNGSQQIWVRSEEDASERVVSNRPS